MLEMKRKATKSGHEKRLEKKKNELKEAATASGQTSLLSSFGFTKSNTSSRPKTASPIDGESTSIDSMKDDKNVNEYFLNSQ